MAIHYSPLTNEEIILDINSDMKCRRLFRGVYAADTLPNKIQTPSVVIVNTDPSELPGEHWIAIYIDNKNNGIYFDSYGKAPYVTHHISFLENNCKKYSFNKKSLQDPSTSVCGHYCCLFVAASARGISLAQFLKKYKEGDSLSNDARTIINFRKLFGKSQGGMGKSRNSSHVNIKIQCACALERRNNKETHCACVEKCI